jgi:hypothetical protein
LEKLIETSDLLGFSLYESFLTLDSGFDSEDNKLIIEWHNLKPVIKPNRRGTKDQEKLTEMYENFNGDIYKERFKIERTFAWQDTYRKLVIRYEKLECTHNGFKHLAYTMINLRQMLNGGNLI